MSKKLVISLVLAVAFLFATNVRAELMLVSELMGNGEIAQKLELTGFTGMMGSNNGHMFLDAEIIRTSSNTFYMNVLPTEGFETAFNLIRLWNVNLTFAGADASTEITYNYFAGTAGQVRTDVPLTFVNGSEGVFTGEVISHPVGFGSNNWFREGMFHAIADWHRIDFYADGNFAGSVTVAWNNPWTGSVYEPAVIPEPATLAIVGLGLAGLGLVRRRMKK